MISVLIRVLEVFINLVSFFQNRDGTTALWSVQDVNGNKYLSPLGTCS